MQSNNQLISCTFLMIFSFRSQKILSINYIKVHRLFLWLLGAWPEELFDEKISFVTRNHRRSMVIQTACVMMGQFNYLIQNRKEINVFDAGHVCLTISLTVLTFVRTILLSLNKYGAIIKKFITKFHLENFKHVGKHFDEINTTTNKISWIFLRIMLVFVALGITGFNAIPLYNNYKAGVFSNEKGNDVKYEFSVYYKFPGFDIIDHFILNTIYSIYLSVNCGIYIPSIDLFLILMMFQMVAHLRALKGSLNNLSMVDNKISLEDENDLNSMPVLEMFSNEENYKIHQRLKAVIDHHRFIVEFAGELSSFFGPMLGINYLCHLFLCCLSLFECSQGDANTISKYGPLTILIFGQLILISVIFEIVQTESEKLRDELYYVSWERMNVRNRRTLCIFLQRLQEPISITSMGMVSVGVQTMAKILKTTFSYFTFLMSMKDNEQVASLP
nr:odorant receptor 36 [Papilio glaucus]